VLEHKSDNIFETRKDRAKVTMEGLYELTNALSDGTIADPPFHRLEFHNLHPKLQSLLFQERVQLHTSNLAGTFTGFIQTKANGKVGVSKDCLNFLAPLLSQERTKLQTSKNRKK